MNALPIILQSGQSARSTPARTSARLLAGLFDLLRDVPAAVPEHGRDLLERTGRALADLGDLARDSLPAVAELRRNPVEGPQGEVRRLHDLTGHDEFRDRTPCSTPARKPATRVDPQPRSPSRRRAAVAERHGDPFQCLQGPHAGAGDLAGDVFALLRERRHQFGPAPVDDAVEVVHPRADRGGKIATARREARVGVGGRPGERTGHRLDARREPAVDRAGAALGGIREVGEPRVDDARALVGGFGNRGEARVDEFRVSPGGLADEGRMAVVGVVDRGSVALQRGAEAGTLALEQIDEFLRMLADAPLEVGAIVVKPLADVLQRRDDLVPETLDAAAERTGHLVDPAGQRGVDVGRQARQALGQFADPGAERLADLGRLGVQALDEFASAFAERPRGFERVAREDFRHGLAPLREVLVDAAHQGFDRSRDLLQPGRCALVESLETGVELGRGLGAAAAQLFVERAAAIDERLLDGRELRGEIIHQRVGAVADLGDELVSASLDRALEPVQAVAERGFETPGVRSERVVDRIVMRGRNGLELPEALGRPRREVLQMRAEALVEVLAPRFERGVDRLDMAGELGAQLVRVGRDPVDHAVAVVADQIVERVEILPHASGLPGQGLDQPAALVVHDGVERGHPRAQLPVDVVGRASDRGRRFAGQGDEPVVDPGRLGAEAGRATPSRPSRSRPGSPRPERTSRRRSAASNSSTDVSNTAV